MKHCDCSPFARPASFAQLAMAAYTPLLAIETIPSPFCSGADILPLTMGRFAPEADLQARDVARPEYEEPTLHGYFLTCRSAHMLRGTTICNSPFLNR